MDKTPTPIHQRDAAVDSVPGLIDDPHLEASHRIAAWSLFLAVGIPALVGGFLLLQDAEAEFMAMPLLFIGLTLGGALLRRRRFSLSPSPLEATAARLRFGTVADNEIRPPLLSPSEQTLHVQALLDLVEGPDTFYNNNAALIRLAGLGVGAVGWLGGAVATLIISRDWATAGVCLVAAAVFGGLAWWGRTVDEPRIRSLSRLNDELASLRVLTPGSDSRSDSPTPPPQTG